ncbi:unnamed protein product, partial [Hapterophycus canaliculatus]
VPPDEIRVEEEVVDCLMAIFNKEVTGLSTLQKGNSNLWPVIVRSAVDSTSDSVRSSLLKVLTVMLETREDGLKVVLGALDVAKAQKNKDGRFSILVDALSEASTDRLSGSCGPAKNSSNNNGGKNASSEGHDGGGSKANAVGGGGGGGGGGEEEDGDESTAAAAAATADLRLAVAVTVFLNTVLSKAFEFEERVFLRGEMVEAGMVDAVARARERWDDDDDDDDDDDEGKSEGGDGADGSGGGGGNREVHNVAKAMSGLREAALLLEATSDDEDDEDGGDGDGAGESVSSRGGASQKKRVPAGRAGGGLLYLSGSSEGSSIASASSKTVEMITPRSSFYSSGWSAAAGSEAAVAAARLQLKLDLIAQ